jgi:hypothetical protein
MKLHGAIGIKDVTGLARGWPCGVYLILDAIPQCEAVRSPTLSKNILSIRFQMIPLEFGSSSQYGDEFSDGTNLLPCSALNSLLL